MSLQQTEITLTPTWSEKGLKVSGGAPAVREKVFVTLKSSVTENGGIPDGLTLRIFPTHGQIFPCFVQPFQDFVLQHPSLDYARFPLSDTDSWTISDEDLTCLIDLNTENLIREFKCSSADDLLEAFVVVESGGDTDNLYALGRMMIRNWMVDSGDPVPGSSFLKQRVDALETKTSNHAHTGGDGSVKIDHANLLNKGVRSHAEIDQLFYTVGQKANVIDLTAETTARGSADTAIGLRVTSLENALPGKANKPAQSVLDAISALTSLSTPFTETQMYQKVNEIVSIVKGLYS